MIGALRAAEPSLQLKPLPASVEMEPWGEPTQLLLIVQNPGPATVRDLKLTQFVDTYLKASPESQKLKLLKPAQDAAFTVILRPTTSDAISGNIYFRLDYGEGHILTATVPVKMHDAAKLDDILKVDLKTTLASLYEYQSGRVDLQLTNQSRDRLEIERVRPIDYPKFIQFKPSERALSLGPYASGIATFDVSAEGKISNGKQLLLFEVDFIPSADPSSRTRNLIVSKEVDVGIIGESDLLKLFGVPSFFFLPGCLAIWTWGFLWKIKAFRPQMNFELTFGTPEFWFISISSSMLIGWMYWLLWHVNYLRGYDLADIAWVWGLSICIGGAAYLAYAGTKDHLRHKRERLQASLDEAVRARTPSSGDTPIQLLRKLALQQLGLTLTRKTLGDKQVFIVEQNRGQSPIWVARRIHIEWLDSATPESRKKVTELLDSNGRPEHLAGLLEAAAADVTVRWQDNEPPFQAEQQALQSPVEAKIAEQMN
jgi:hypothetical protein